jgi:4-amino-4-deoxy-L-arabinose transferase-like glycosyltransferase
MGPAPAVRVAFFLMNTTENYRRYFILAVTVYALTRFILLPEYPIYFFTDEAVLTVRAEELIQRGFKDDQGRWFPAYFSTGFAYNTSLAVYLQIPGYLLFGKSVWVTRGTVALISVFGAIGTALLLRDGFRCRHYWLAPFFLALMPGWFLHSRTAFDPVLMASFYPWFLYFYLRYFERGGWNLLISVLFGAATFYAYSAGQAVMVFSGLFLALANFRHHWKHRRQSLAALAVILLCAFPYFRFRFHYPEALGHQLTLLNSYWVQNTPLSEKIMHFLREYLYGLDPRFWFGLNEEGLGRHQMKDYAHLMRWGAPLLLAGLAVSLCRFREPAMRALWISVLVSPIGAALVDTGIVRVLVFVVPAAVLMALGTEWIFSLSWILRKERLWAMGLAGVLCLLSVHLLTDALVKGPFWYRDYGMYGLQWGARQLLGEALPDEIRKRNPPAIFLSSSWANGADFLLSYFAPGKEVKISDISQFRDYYRPFPEGTVFVLTYNQYKEIEDSPKFKPFAPDRILAYPDGSPGFFFLRLRYADDVEEQFKKEMEARRQLLKMTHPLLGQQAEIGYSAVDMGSGPELFDGNSQGIIRGKEANPYVVEIRFPQPQPLSSARIYLRDGNYAIKALVEGPNGPEVSHQAEYRSGSGKAPVVEMPLGCPGAKRVRFEIYGTDQGDIACIHLYEIELRP